MKHPCLKCGACCAYFRVAFYWREGNPDEHDHAVPENMWFDLTALKRVMRGTEKKHQPKCEALKGHIGQQAHCSIYENRPSPCRSFPASFEDGTPNLKCDAARAKHGLPPLRREDWKNSFVTSESHQNT